MIHIVGAGPGDPELITLKGYRLLKDADLVVYAGSLVNPDILKYCKEDAKIVDSAHLNLEEIIDVMVEYHEKDKKVVRLHTGDPSLYGAIGEQMLLLDEKNIGYEIVPGVSSFLAAAAALKRQYTIPDGSQTMIITRLEGRTPVPETEKLKDLARHRSSLAIFLSVGMIEKVMTELKEIYPHDYPAAVVEKASWPEERVIKGNINNIAGLVKDAGIRKTALILVGEFITHNGKSKLYDGRFTHEYRKGK